MVKCVCSNFTALPVLYSPVDQKSWGPPYRTATLPTPTPMFRANETCGRKGFEEPTLYTPAEDGFLHFIAHNHGGACEVGARESASVYSHFISRTHMVDAWERAPGLIVDGMEPVPVPTSGDGAYRSSFRSRVDLVCYGDVFLLLPWTT